MLRLFVNGREGRAFASHTNEEMQKRTANRFGKHFGFNGNNGDS